MFSLIALYFEYRKLRTQRAEGAVAAKSARRPVANDTIANWAITAAA